MYFILISEHRFSDTPRLKWWLGMWVQTVVVLGQGKLCFYPATTRSYNWNLKCWQFLCFFLLKEHYLSLSKVIICFINFYFYFLWSRISCWLTIRWKCLWTSEFATWPRRMSSILLPLPPKWGGYRCVSPGVSILLKYMEHHRAFSCQILSLHQKTKTSGLPTSYW